MRNLTYAGAAETAQYCASHLAGTIVTLSVACALYAWVFLPLVASPLRAIPGPKAYAATKWRLAWDDYQGTRTRAIHRLHKQHGSAVRIGPREVSFSSLSALRTIYGAGSGSERTGFYRMFDVYGRQNLFTFAETKKHGERKKLLAHAYAKSVVLSDASVAKQLIEENVKRFLELIERDKEATSEIFDSLHWFSLDSITGFIYGEGNGGTHALRGDQAHRAMLDDIRDPARRRLTWFAFHLKSYTQWLYTRTGLLDKVIDSLGLLPMSRPTTYTAIRAHALKSCLESEPAVDETKTKVGNTSFIISKLWEHCNSEKEPRVDALDIASEAADHFLAGIDTTSDTLMFAIWALSLPENRHCQERLIAEIDSMSPELFKQGPEVAGSAVAAAEVADRLPYLNAVIKETLRLYAPIPGSEPRSMPADTTIDGYRIPAGTVVSMSPYTLHRNEAVFPQMLEFRPERWLGGLGDPADMKKYFWAFSSGGRMCIGLHFAMAEMTTLLASLYKHYTTCEQEKQKGASPAISSRFELFYDERFERVTEHACFINFKRRAGSLSPGHISSKA
ncbi:hypothetical protein PpBr36_02319 [Pyricularia pennisetigena]|uniref:hypothetical protein n=1 Tax=Pyricularia pennisetigena TaxID=1578925 RepID=UPI0011548B8B|nr:hypothetical protein PpBr36_02319 [Pyricularia pennisetigena]TLS31214.1 hypothetical protein PpBr36_02319 [Pyricularia pennisetigena]